MGETYFPIFLEKKYDKFLKDWENNYICVFITILI